jgi:hypothetical protein
MNRRSFLAAIAAVFAVPLAALTAAFPPRGGKSRAKPHTQRGRVLIELVESQQGTALDIKRLEVNGASVLHMTQAVSFSFEGGEMNHVTLTLIPGAIDFIGPFHGLVTLQGLTTTEMYEEIRRREALQVQPLGSRHITTVIDK